MGIDRRHIKYVLLLGSAEEESIELASKVEDILGNRLGATKVRRLVLTENETATDTNFTFASLRALRIPKGILLVGFGMAGLLAACYQDRRREDLHVIAICSPEPFGPFLPRARHRNLMMPLTEAEVLILSSICVREDKLQTLPKLQEPAKSRTWRIEDHGRVVFGTFSETASVYGLFVAGLLVGAVGLSNEKRHRARKADSSKLELP